MKKPKSTKPASEEFQRFECLAKTLIAVPKDELDKRQAAHDKAKKTAKKRKIA